MGGYGGGYGGGDEVGGTHEKADSARQKKKKLGQCMSESFGQVCLRHHALMSSELDARWRSSRKKLDKSISIQSIGSSFDIFATMA